MNYEVKEITITVSRKDWHSDAKFSGSSGESSFTWTVRPDNPGQSWSREEAAGIQMRVAKNLYSTLLLDATAKKDSGACRELDETISFYEQALGKKEEVSPCEESPSPA